MLENNSNSNDNKRIAKNTLYLFARSLLSMVVALYTTRVILKTLGVDDFGIYNVVGGVVLMFIFINSAMITSTQRFLTFELGKGNLLQLKRVFSMTLNIHMIIALIIFVLAETIGLWFLNNKMVIPFERIGAANWVYQLSVISAMISITQVPYTASIISHERFNIYAYVGIAETVLRLVIVLFLVLIPWDKLKLFALLSFVVSGGIAFFYRLYCKREFQECSYHFDRDHKLFKTLISFTGWSFLGNSSYMMLIEGMNILINLFFGVTVNAARGITIQVSTAINGLVGNFTSAINPQITKNYANNKLKEMNVLMLRGAKFSFFIMFLFSLPVLIETEMILTLWLKIVPAYTVIFVRLNIIIILILSLTHPYYTAIFATGEIKRYQLMITVMIFILVSITYILLKLGFPPEIIYIIHIIVSFFELIFRVSIVKRLIGFSIFDYINHVILKAIVVVLITIPVPLFLYSYFQPSFLRLVSVSLASILITIISIVFAGLTKLEKKKVFAIVSLKLNSIRNRKIIV